VQAEDGQAAMSATLFGSKHVLGLIGDWIAVSRLHSYDDAAVQNNM
jgi:hypothetical protein